MLTQAFFIVFPPVSRMKLQQDLRTLLGSILDLILSVLAADCGVVLLIDSETGILTANTVRVREGKLTDTKEIPISSTILRIVLERKTCVITSDAILDPRFNGSDSISRQHMRSVICVPLIGSSNVSSFKIFRGKRINRLARAAASCPIC
jgi:GAF domain-containing protein